MLEYLTLLHIILALLCAPFMLGIINRVKAYFAGRRGRPLLQLYYDLFKLMRKGEVISKTTTVIFGMGASLALSVSILTLLFLPFAGQAAALTFSGDFIFVAYLLALARFMLILSALDTGSPFEGMGASREAAYSSLVEPVLFLSFLALISSDSTLKIAENLSLSTFINGNQINFLQLDQPQLLFIPIVIFILLLVETYRIPVDDPNTHLELTMIHEVMVLDHSGPNLAFILYGSALKLWFFSALLAGLIVPNLGMGIGMQIMLNLIFIFGIAFVIGIIESIMARLKLPSISVFISSAGVLVGITLILSLVG